MLMNVIFVNIICNYGDYWHNLPKVKKRDKVRCEVYKNDGYDLLVVWQHELKNLDIPSKYLSKELKILFQYKVDDLKN